MIELGIQIKLIVFSFIFGFAFSFILDIFNNLIKKYSKIFEIVFSFILICFMTFIYFIGIEKIGDGIFHIYSIIVIIIGFLTYNMLIKIIANISKK